MTTAMTIAELLDRGTSLSVPEAVAIVLSVIDASNTLHGADVREPYGPPSPENIELGLDGSLVCTGCAATPAVSEVGILLQRLLDRTPRIPGGLRYALGRALLDVEAPPFDSLDEFARSLARFEEGDRRAVIQALVERGDGRLVSISAPRLVSVRAPAPQPPPEPAVPADRRLQSTRADQLRRELRAADERLYERTVAATVPVATPSTPPDAGRSRTWWPALAAVAALLVLSMTIMGARWRHEPESVRVAMTAAHRDTIPPPPARSTPEHAARAAAEPLPPARPATATRDRPAITNVAAREPGTAADGRDGWLVPTLDVNQRPVFSPAFESKGSAIFFHAGRAPDRRSALTGAETSRDQLRVITVQDDGARNYHVQPSPDGRQIAFDSDRDGDRGVYVANRDGSNVRRVSGPGFAAVPTWSPDGTRLAFVRAEAADARTWNLWLLTLATGATERLTDYRYGQPWSASWFPDGHRIAYAHEERLYIRDLRSGATRSFETPVPGHLVRTPVVSPDGSRIVFQVHRNGAWLLDLADGTMRCVLQDPTAEEFAWAPDGRRVAFHSRRDGQWGIYVMAKRD